MGKKKLSKAERQRNREIVGLYHKKVTEEELHGLLEEFVRWKNGELPYYDLTDKIHEFHKSNQKIWSKFNYNSIKKLLSGKIVTVMIRRWIGRITLG